MRFVASAADFSYYSERLREKFILRRIISTSNKFIAKAYDDAPEVSMLLDNFETDVLKVRESMESDEVVLSIQEHLVKAIDQIQEMLDNPNAMAGISTGFKDFDEMTRGMQAGQMIVVAARPGMGKTSFAMNVVENIALKSKIPVAVFSLEMTSEQLVPKDALFAGEDPDAQIARRRDVVREARFPTADGGGRRDWRRRKSSSMTRRPFRSWLCGRKLGG